jgi:uncharacterized protein YheU (UPF0270 family)
MKDADEHTPPPVEVAPDQLSPQALRGVVEAFVLREGTNYGLREVDFETKVAQVLRQLESGDAQILFDPATESVTIAPTVRPRGTARWRKNPP